MRLPLTPRTGLTAALVLAAAAPAGAAQAADARTRTWTAPVGPAPVRLAPAADHVALTWRGPDAGGAIRFRRAGRWTAWRPLRHGDPAAGGRVASAPIAARRARAVQVRLPPGARAGRLVAIRSRSAAPLPGRRHATAAARLPGPLGPLCYYSRAAWGADESLRVPNPPAFFPVQTLTVHHTATVNDDPDPAATVRAIYAQHVVANGFDDIGYQLLIDARGCVYDGRASGDDGLPVYAGLPIPGEPFLAVNGAHAAGFNAGNAGVALLGEFTGRPPTAAARRSLAGVLALQAAVSRVDPLGRVAYVNPISGAARDADAIGGHRDWNPTECPGDALYAHLPAIRARVARLLRFSPFPPPLSAAPTGRRR
jgi:hypothetical protein